MYEFVIQQAEQKTSLHKHFYFCNSIQQCLHTDGNCKATDLATKYQIIKAYQEINVSNNKICMHYSLSSALLHSHYSHM